MTQQTSNSNSQRCEILVSEAALWCGNCRHTVAIPSTHIHDSHFLQDLQGAQKQRLPNCALTLPVTIDTECAHSDVLECQTLDTSRAL
jgi:hypothetical protein